MAFHDEVNTDINRKIIPKFFSVQDLKTRPDGHVRFLIGDNSYAENAINTIPYNASVSENGDIEGDYVQRGQNPKFYRLDNALFRMYQ